MALYTPQQKRGQRRKEARARALRNVDPLAPLTSSQLRAQVLGDIRPITNELAASSAKRTAAGAANIEGITNRLAQSLSGYQAKQQDIYSRARGSLEGYQAQGAQALGAASGAIGSNLTSALALSGNAPGNFGAEQSRVAGGIAARGAGELGELALRQAAAENYAAKLPGFAKLAGAQGIRELQARRQQELAEAQTKIRTETIPQLTQQARTREYEKAVAARGFGVDFAKIQQDAAEASQRAQTASQAEAGRNRRAAATTSVSARRASEAARHNRNMEAISRRGGNTRAATAAETRRHNRATEKISRKKGLKGSSGGGIP